MTPRMPGRVPTGTLLLIAAALAFTTQAADAAPIVWTGAAGGSWHSPTNWDLGRVPGPGDDVEIPDLPGNASVTHNDGSTSINSLTCAEVLNVINSRISVAAASSISNTFALSGGAFDGSGVLTIASGVTWTVSGSNPAVNAVVNNGACAVTSTGTTFSMGDFTNAAGATLETASATLNGTRFENRTGAIFRKTGAGSSHVEVRITNAGTVEVTGGVLIFAQNGSSSTGTVTGSAGTTIRVGGGEFLFLSGSVLSSAGTLSFGSVATIDAGAAFTPGPVVELYAGTLSLHGPTTFQTFNMSGGTLAGNGDVTVATGLNWTGGQLSGTRTFTIPAGMSWALNSQTTVNSDVTLVNNGQCTLTGSQVMGLVGVFRNAPGADFQIPGNAGLGNGGRFENEAGATFRKSGVGASVIDVRFLNAGSVEVAAGTLRFASHGNSSSGGIVTSAGTALELGTGTFVFAPGSVLATAGTLSILGSVTIDAGTSYTPGPVVNVIDATLFLNVPTTLQTLNLIGNCHFSGNGDATVTTAFNWGVGGTIGGNRTFTIPAGLHWTLNASGPNGFPIASPTVFVNNGHCTLNGVGVSLTPVDQGVFRNAPGGVVDVRSSTSIGTGRGLFENQSGAVLKRSSGAGVFVMNTTFVNGGQVSLETGTMVFMWGGHVLNDGSRFETKDGTSLVFQAHIDVRSGATLSPAGPVTFGGGQVIAAGAIFTPDTVNVEAIKGIRIDAEVTIPILNYRYGGPVLGAGHITVTREFNWVGGHLGHSGAPGLRLTTAAGSVTRWEYQDVFGLEATVYNDGLWTLVGGNAGTLVVGAFHNRCGGVVDIQSDGSLLQSQGWAIDNQRGGTIRKSSGPGTMSLGAYLTNAGTVEVLSGRLLLDAHQGILQSAGTTRLENGAALAIRYQQSGLIGLFDIQGGSLTGSGTVDGHLRNGGLVAPGGPVGAITVANTYTQTAAGRLAVDLAGLASDTEYDALHVTGDISLAGELAVLPVGGFIPGPSVVFDVVTTAGAKVGSFVTSNLPFRADDGCVALVDRPNGVRLERGPLVGCGDPIITATAGPGGSISPGGAQQVAFGSSRTFAISPAPGNQVVDVLVDGASIGAVTTHTFTDVRTIHAIHVAFNVNEGSTSTILTLASTSNPSVCSQEIALVATVDPAGAPGWVEFYDGYVLLATMPLAEGTAQLTTASLEVGEHSITGVYRPLGCYSVSKTALSHTVNEGCAAPVCDAGGPYAVQCHGAATVLALDGTGSSAAGPDDLLTFHWTTDHPNAAFDDATIAQPMLVFGSGVASPAQFNATLTVTNGMHTLARTVPVVVEACGALGVGVQSACVMNASGTDCLTMVRAEPWDVLFCVVNDGTGPLDDWSFDIDLINLTRGETTAIVAGQVGSPLPVNETRTIQWPSGIALDPTHQGNHFRVEVKARVRNAVEAPDRLFNNQTATEFVAEGVTSVLLGLFQAEVVESGLELRWSFGDAQAVRAVILERSDGPTGPWAALAVEYRRDGDVFVALDADGEPGRTYHYRLVATLAGGAQQIFGPLSATADAMITEFALTRLAPNPTQGTTLVEFTVPRVANVDLVIYDVMGREVAVLAAGEHRRGRYQATWTGKSKRGPAAPGLYFVRYRTPTGQVVRRLSLTR